MKSIYLLLSILFFFSMSIHAQDKTSLPTIQIGLTGLLIVYLIMGQEMMED